MPKQTMPTDWNVELETIGRQRKYAEMLRQQSLDPIKSETAGGYVVPIHPFQGLAKLLQAYGGRRGEEIATEQSKDVVSRRNKALADTIRGAFDPMTTPGKEAQMGEMGETVEPAVAATSRQRTPQEISQALLANPDTMNLGGQMMIKDVEGRNASERAMAQARYQHDLKMDPAYIQSQKDIRSVDKPYYTPVQTGQGVYSFNARTGKMELTNAGGAPVVGSQSDPNLQARIAYGKKAGTETGDVDVQQHETAISALENINKIDQLVTHLKESDAITGMGSDFFKNIERAKVMVTNSEKSGKKVSDTELLDTMMGSEVFPLIKSLGIGARGMDTPAEREFMRSVLTGQTNLNKQTLIRMAEIRKDVANRAIKRWNDRVGTGELDRYFETTGRPKSTLNAPSGGNTKTIGGKTYIKQNGQWFEQ
mgnify:CR=1 FL=1